MRRLVSFVILVIFAFGGIFWMPEAALAKKRVRRTRVYRKYRRMPLKSYYKYFLNPAIKDEDATKISESLRGQGVDSVKVVPGGSSLILKFKASEVSAVDLMQTLKQLGYTVTGIN